VMMVGLEKEFSTSVNRRVSVPKINGRPTVLHYFLGDKSGPAVIEVPQLLIPATPLCVIIVLS
jgi:hypothetical protein